MAKRKKSVRKPATARKAPTKGKPALADVDGKKEISRLRRELAEALERQKATSDILNAINTSTVALQPILDTIVKTASRLCEAEFANIFKLQGGKYHLAATNSTATTIWLRRTVRRPPSSNTPPSIHCPPGAAQS